VNGIHRHSMSRTIIPHVRSGPVRTHAGSRKMLGVSEVPAEGQPEPTMIASAASAIALRLTNEPLPEKDLGVASLRRDLSPVRFLALSRRER